MNPNEKAGPLFYGATDFHLYHPTDALNKKNYFNSAAKFRVN